MSGVPSLKTSRVPVSRRKPAARRFTSSDTAGLFSGSSMKAISPGLPPSRTFSGGFRPTARSSFSALQARTTPATVLRSARPSPAWPRRMAVSTRSLGWEAPRRKEKLLAVASSA
ncbi:hypothetical protein D3C86_1109420 [compost metagenome]